MPNRKKSTDDLLETGIGMMRIGALADAEKVFRTILVDVPGELNALESLAMIFMEKGNFGEASDYLNAVLRKSGERADLYYNLGNACANSGRLFEAATAYERAVEIESDFIEAWFNLGDMLEKLDRLEKSINAYEKVIELDPYLASGLTNLGCVLTEVGRFEAAIRAFEKSIELEPTFAPTYMNLGNAHKYAGDMVQAIAAYREAIRLAPDYADARYNLGANLSLTGDFAEAERMLVSALELRPKLTRAKFALGAAYIGLEKADAAVALCSEAPDDSCEMFALKPFAVAAQGDGDNAFLLADYDRLIGVSQFSAPNGRDSLTSFNKELVAHILDHPSLTYAPTSHATVNGKHTGNLLTEPKGPFEDFEKYLWREVESYREELYQGGNPLFPGDRSLTDLVVWSIVMEAGGHQVPHIHPSGWISGVYYPKSPKDLATDANLDAGCLEFGAPPPEIPFTGRPHLKMVRPEEGLLVLFPSFFYHRTIPFDSDTPRVSIAFDFCSNRRTCI